MYCSGCGMALAAGQPFCPQCGRPVGPVIPPVPGLQFQLESFAGKVKALGVVWLVYAALSLMLGIAGLTFAQAFFSSVPLYFTSYGSFSCSAPGLHWPPAWVCWSALRGAA